MKLNGRNKNNQLQNLIKFTFHENWIKKTDIKLHNIYRILSVCFPRFPHGYKLPYIVTYFKFYHVDRRVELECTLIVDRYNISKLIIHLMLTNNTNQINKIVSFFILN